MNSVGSGPSVPSGKPNSRTLFQLERPSRSSYLFERESTWVVSSFCLEIGWMVMSRVFKIHDSHPVQTIYIPFTLLSEMAESNLLMISERISSIISLMFANKVSLASNDIADSGSGDTWGMPQPDLAVVGFAWPVILMFAPSW